MSQGKNPHWGTTLDAFLTAEGIRKAVADEALTHIVTWQREQEMQRQGITAAGLAERMKNNRN